MKRLAAIIACAALWACAGDPESAPADAVGRADAPDDAGARDAPPPPADLPADDAPVDLPDETSTDTATPVDAAARDGDPHGESDTARQPAALGAACSTDEDCASGHCAADGAEAAGRCCRAACRGPCDRCELDGACTAVACHYPRPDFTAPQDYGDPTPPDWQPLGEVSPPVPCPEGGRPCDGAEPWFPWPRGSGSRRCTSDRETIECTSIGGSSLCARIPWCGQDAHYVGDEALQAAAPEALGEHAGGSLVRDPVTSLVWWQGGPTAVDHADATAACEMLEPIPGGAGFTLPDRDALLTLSKAVRARRVVTLASTAWALTGPAAAPDSAWQLAPTGALRAAARDGDAGSALCVAAPVASPTPPAGDRFSVIRGRGGRAVFDRATGLFWAPASEGLVTWDEARKACERASAPLRSDWRLPSAAQLAVVATLDLREPHGPVAADGARAPLWSSTAVDDDPGRAWAMAHGGGLVDGHPRTDRVRALCTTRWVDRGDSTVHDDRTGQRWIAAPAPTGLAHPDAGPWCADQVVAGLRGWRLPRIDELRALVAGCAGREQGGRCPIVDPGCLRPDCRTDDCSPCALFEGPHGGCYWEPGVWRGPCNATWSSSVAPDGGNPWGLNFTGAFLGVLASPRSPFEVRCVRDP